MPINPYIHLNSLKIDMHSFYSNLSKANFNNITKKRILELKANSLTLNKFLHNEYTELSRPRRYVTIMNNLKSRPKSFGINMDNYYAEMYILFIFAVDPKFEVAIINGEYNRTYEIKQKMEEYLGIYDLNLIRLENFYLKYLATEKKRNKINEEIDKRVFK